MCTPLPDGLPTPRAVLAANMETAVNILWDARPLAGERALVIGAGVVGLLVAALLAGIPGLDLTVCDADATRAPLVASLGGRFCTPDAAPAERELIIHASGSAAGLHLALGCAGFEARILEASWHGDAPVPLPLGEAFHARRLALLSTQVGAIAAPMRGRRSHAERLALALALLDDARLDALLGAPLPFADLPAALQGVFGDAGGPPCPVITYI
jgi:threonine dehydrogenase-like Zn-dependent dehydrogenase